MGLKHKGIRGLMVQTVLAIWAVIFVFQFSSGTKVRAIDCSTETITVNFFPDYVYYYIGTYLYEWKSELNGF